MTTTTTTTTAWWKKEEGRVSKGGEEGDPHLQTDDRFTTVFYTLVIMVSTYLHNIICACAGSIEIVRRNSNFVRFEHHNNNMQP